LFDRPLAGGWMMMFDQEMAPSASCSTVALGHVTQLLCKERGRNGELEVEVKHQRETIEALQVELGLYKNESAVVNAKQKSE
jgi:hypothetical protein